MQVKEKDVRRKFMGGQIVLRTPGEMQGEDGLVQWDQAVVLTQGRKSFVMYRDSVVALLTMAEDPNFMHFLEGCVEQE